MIQASPGSGEDVSKCVTAKHTKPEQSDMEMNRILLHLAGRGIRYRYLKVTGTSGRPEALSLEVTQRCIAKCLMCNIWQMPPSPEIEACDWLELLQSPALSELKELDVTGGEPFLRDDLAELLLGIGRLKKTHLPLLCSVAITTNGFLTEKILSDVGRVIAPLGKAGVTLVFACGMDAVGETHNRIRNYPEGWAKLHATIEGLKGLRNNYPSLVLGIKTTITRHNIDELDQVCRYADDQGLFTIISPYILTANRYANLGRETMLEFSPQDLEKMRCFYASSRFQWSYYRNELLHFLESGRMKKPCSAGFNYFFIRSTGELFPCPIIKFPLGNVLQTPLEELICSVDAARFRQGVTEFPECATCTEPGLERYALPFEGFHYLRQYFKLGRDGFCTLHRHLGLDKYFP
jgi:MoaA/NifB/PqqE/SkfB family radical SAM enzyme